MAEWFHGTGGLKNGPVSESAMIELMRAGQISADTFVWSAGFDQWTPLSQTALSRHLPAKPLPLPDAVIAETASIISISENRSNRIGFINSVKICFRKYFEHKGRAQRSEYWYFQLFITILYTFSSLLFLIISLVNYEFIKYFSSILTFILFIATILIITPLFNVSVRRLHDLNHSGWWVLFIFIPYLGQIAFLIYMCFRGTVGSNRFGPDPLAAP
jgi:uncharacterized membrane protein YhaH (DUF805 family)